MSHKKFYNMTIFWIIISCVCSFVTIFSAYKISQIGSDETNEIIRRQNHPIPESLFLDAVVTLKVGKDFKNIYEQKILPKFYVANGKAKEINPIPISSFFDEIKFSKQKVFNENYNIKSDYFDNLKNFAFFAKTSTQANNTSLNLSLNKSIKIKFTKESNIDDYSNIDIESYDMINQTVKLKFKNIKLDITANSFSGTLLDVQNSKIVSSFIFHEPFKIVKIENFILKTKRVSYYSIKEIETNDLSQISGKLKLLNNIINKN